MSDYSPLSTAEFDGTVAVCICTYRRPRQLEALLAGLARQKFAVLRRPTVRVVVVDNQGDPATAKVCERFSTACDWPLSYRHEPQRGISHARNACLDSVADKSDFIAMIDDDEIPEPQWLEQLLLTRAATRADVVQGPVHAVLPPDAARWMRRGHFFGFPYFRHREPVPEPENGAAIAFASTNNVLVRRRAIQSLGLRFDPRLALSGGEDVLFFRQMQDAGCRFAYASGAIVCEPVPQERASFRYLCRAEFRDGCLKFTFKQLSGKRPTGASRAARRLRIAFRGTLDVAAGSTCILTSGLCAYRIALSGLRIAHGMGLLAGACGWRYQHYARSDSP